MNEVRLAQTPALPAVSSASSKGAAEKTQASGKVLPETSAQQAPQASPQVKANSANDLQQAVANVNQHVQSIQRDLQFSVDEDLERTVIKVVDSDSGELIRQIPEDIFLELARRLNDDGEMHLMDAIG